MNKYLYSTRKIIRIALLVSIFSIIISCFIVIVGGKLNYGNYYDFSTIFIWYSIMLTIWALFCSFIGLGIISIYLKMKKEKVWENISKETIISTFGIISLIALTLIIKFIK